MAQRPGGGTGVEAVGALSLATDLGTGQPLEHALRTAVLAVRLGELAGASDQELVDTYYDLGISAKTVGHHVQHVYQKASVRSRAAATLWAFEHDLVRSA